MQKDSLEEEANQALQTTRFFGNWSMLQVVAVIVIFAFISSLSLSLENFDFNGAIKNLLRGLRWIGCRGRVFECLALFGPWTSTTANGRQDEAHWKQGTTQQLKATSPHLTSVRLHNSPSAGRQPRWESET
ncbi:hypothetical protein CI238_00020 [Colletotrichum incanum]|uniref:Uncharacterized protein n=1 Tax=Colletotrichum incanum TaxID=1573173 RepID=A0A161VCU3_COLIC|nr:hypothetical protein CI238_00020 [Colletotrichum incanum]